MDDTAPRSVQKLLGVQYIRLQTNGDGVCALYSVFSHPNLDKDNEVEFFATKNRQKLVATFGRTTDEFQYGFDTTVY